MRWFWQALAVLAAVALVGLSPVSASDPALVAIKTFQFKPAPLEVREGTQVTWTNGDDIRHTVTSGTPGNQDGRFNASLAGKDATFSFTFSQPGVYPYFCDRHQSMRGEIRVN